MNRPQSCEFVIVVKELNQQCKEPLNKLFIFCFLFKQNELCTFQLNRRSYVLLCRAIMTLHLFSFLYVFFFIPVGLSQRAGGRGFSPATFIENKRKIEPEELPGCTIPLLLIAFTLQLEKLAIAL